MADDNGWLPIEGGRPAPRDGRSLLLWLADEGFWVQAWWDRVEGMWYLPTMDHWQSDDGLHQITHWMRPLPPAPAAQRNIDAGRG